MMRHMGYGQRFDLPFPSQRYGTVPDPAWLQRREHRDWAEYDTINVSIGQGYLLVNPLQQAMQVARIASGRALHPRLLADDAGQCRRRRCRFRPSISPSSASAMEAVVNGNGTATGARLPIEGVLMGGKTGTAQVRRITLGERAGGVRSNESLAWRMRDHCHFVAFAPTAHPRYACAAIVEHGGWGASAAAPLVRDVMTYLFDKDRAMAAWRRSRRNGAAIDRPAHGRSAAREWAARRARRAAPPVRSRPDGARLHARRRSGSCPGG